MKDEGTAGDRFLAQSQQKTLLCSLGTASGRVSGIDFWIYLISRTGYNWG
jgi:hypothetical protein